ncbi:MAG TPA: glycosyltransferase [candidate division Zixibacteria bacterium]|nr:glycosyltransferase [candidate division Zixibacteria bacterium]
MKKRSWLVNIEDYAPLIGEEAVERTMRKAQRLRGMHVVHVSSTFYGGGVAEILSSETLLARSLGIRAEWRLIQGTPDFFSVTKKIHNALQGAAINLTDLKKEIYETVILQNAMRMDIGGDFVVIHDPQPLPLVQHTRHTCPWVWRCHVDLSNPNPEIWDYLRGFVDQYDAVVLSLPEYRRELAVPQLFIMPAIDPFSAKNAEMSEDEIRDRLRHYRIPTELPIVCQVSRFDRWKDPEGVIEAFRIARREIDATLVLIGNVALDDPEGQEVFESLLKNAADDVWILTVEDSALVNALQRRAHVIVQKSLREGFGLTAAEAMWKGTPVIAGRCGGLRHQIEDGVNGFLVSSVQECAARIVQLVRDEKLRREMGRRARQTVCERFLLARKLEQFLDLFSAFEPQFAVDRQRLEALQSGALPGAPATGAAGGARPGSKPGAR